VHAYVCVADLIYHHDGVTGGDGEEVGAGDCLWALSLQLGLDCVDDLEAPKGVGVGHGRLLTDEEWRLVVQEHGAVAALRRQKRTNSITALQEQDTHTCTYVSIQYGRTARSLR
jgi:hypothetical protein